MAVGIERGLAELDPMRAHRGRLVDDLGDVQQRLRRDAADVEADAAERLPGVDQHDAPPEIGGAERRGVAAGTCAEDENVGLKIRLAARIGCGLRRGRGRGLGRGLLDLRAAVRRGGGGRGRRARLRLFALGVGRQHRALADLVANLDADFADHPILGRGHVHRRLVAFEGQDRLFLADAFSGRDLDLDDRHVLEVADIGKPDFLGHGRVSPAIPAQSQKHAPHVLDDPRQMAHEPRRRGAVDDAMIVGQAERQHQPRLKRLPVPDRGHLGTYDAENRHFRRIHDRRERRSADPAERRDGEGRALHFCGRELARARLLGKGPELAGQLDDAFPVNVLDHRDHESVGGVDGDADVPIAPQYQRVAGWT